jgi:hypothetical protein
VEDEEVLKSGLGGGGGRRRRGGRRREGEAAGGRGRGGRVKSGGRRAKSAVERVRLGKEHDGWSCYDCGCCSRHAAASSLRRKVRLARRPRQVRRPDPSILLDVRRSHPRNRCQTDAERRKLLRIRDFGAKVRIKWRGPAGGIKSIDMRRSFPRRDGDETAGGVPRRGRGMSGGESSLEAVAVPDFAGADRRGRR